MVSFFPAVGFYFLPAPMVPLLLVQLPISGGGAPILLPLFQQPKNAGGLFDTNDSA